MGVGAKQLGKFKMKILEERTGQLRGREDSGCKRAVMEKRVNNWKISNFCALLFFANRRHLDGKITG